MLSFGAELATSSWPLSWMFLTSNTCFDVGFWSCNCKCRLVSDWVLFKDFFFVLNFTPVGPSPALPGARGLWPAFFFASLFVDATVVSCGGFWNAFGEEAALFAIFLYKVEPWGFEFDFYRKLLALDVGCVGLAFAAFRGRFPLSSQGWLPRRVFQLFELGTRLMAELLGPRLFRLSPPPPPDIVMDPGFGPALFLFANAVDPAPLVPGKAL